MASGKTPEQIKEELRKRKLEEDSLKLLKESIEKARYDLGLVPNNITFQSWPTFQAKVLEIYEKKRDDYIKKEKIKKNELPDYSKYKFNIDATNASNREVATQVKQNVYQTARSNNPLLIPAGEIPNTHSLLRAELNRTAKELFDLKKPSEYNKRRAEEARVARNEEQSLINEQAAKMRQQREARIAELQAELASMGIDLTEDDNDMGVPFDYFLQTRLARAKVEAQGRPVSVQQEEVPENTPAKRIAKLQARLRALGVHVTEGDNDMGLDFEDFLEARLLLAEKNAEGARQASVAPNGLRRRFGGPPAAKPKEKPQEKPAGRENLLGGPQEQVAAQERLQRRNPQVDTALTEMQRHNAMMEELALNQAIAQEQDREAAAGVARNLERIGQRAVREAAAAREGVVNVRAGQERQNARLFDIRATGEAIKTNTLEIIRTTNETLQITRRIDSGVEEIKRLQRLFASDKKGFFKAIYENELVMGVVFFILHTNFPWTASSLQGIYYNLRLLQRTTNTIKRAVQGQVTYTLGGIAGEISPLAFSYFMIYYNKQLIEYRVTKDPSYTAAFGTTMEDYLGEFIKAPQTYLEEYRDTASKLPMPTKEQILAFLQEKAVQPILEGLNFVMNNKAEPGLLAEMIRDFLLGKLVIVANGVVHTIGVPQAWFQFKTLSACLMWVIGEMFKGFMKVIGDYIWYGIASGICTISNLGSNIDIKWIGKLSFFPDYATCMSSLYGKIKTQGGGAGNNEMNRKVIDDLNLNDEYMKLYLYSPSQFEYYYELSRFEYNMSRLSFMHSQMVGTPLGREYKKLIDSQLDLGANLYEIQQHPSLGFKPYDEAFYWKPPVSGYLQNTNIFLLENTKNVAKEKLDGGRRLTRRYRLRRRQTHKVKRGN